VISRAIISKLSINSTFQQNFNQTVSYIYIYIYSGLWRRPYLDYTYIALNFAITLTARPKAWTVFARSNTGIVGSNPTQAMDVCVCLFCVCIVLCVVAASRLADRRPRGPTDCVKDQETEIAAKVDKGGAET
jgi:hypothetical protein